MTWLELENKRLINLDNADDIHIYKKQETGLYHLVVTKNDTVLGYVCSGDRAKCQQVFDRISIMIGAVAVD